MLKHNKKRNTLLLYEFLSRALVSSFVDNDKKQAEVIKEIIHKFFKKGTELHKEYKLMKALATINVSSDSTVTRIFEDVKSFAKNLNLKALNKEKTKLINEIHNSIKDDNFYKQDVKEYVVYATIQNLLNEYTSNKPNDFEASIRVTLFEDRIKACLREEKNNTSQIILEDKNIYNNSTVKFITSRFNNKFKDLNEYQRDILRAIYGDTESNIRRVLTETRSALLNKIKKIEIDEEVIVDQDVLNRLLSVKAAIKTMDENDTSAFAAENMLRYAELMNYA